MCFPILVASGNARFTWIIVHSCGSSILNPGVMQAAFADADTASTAMQAVEPVGVVMLKHEKAVIGGVPQ